MRRLTWIVFVLCAWSIGATAQEGNDTVIARVNGAPIRQGELFRRLLRLQGSDFILSSSPLAFRNGNAGELVLQNLINERLVLEWGERTKDIPADAELDAEVERAKAVPSIRIAINKRLFTEEYLRYELKVQLTRFNIATVAVSAAPEDVEAFYKKNASRYTIPERWGLSVIRTVEMQTMNLVLKELKEGKSFESLAKKYSDEKQTGQNGGDMGIVSANDAGLPANVRAAIKPLKLGDVSPVTTLEVARSDGKGNLTSWVIFRLTTRLPEAVTPLDNIRKSVERELLLEKAGGFATADKKIAEYRLSAKIEVMLPGFTELGNN